MGGDRHQLVVARHHPHPTQWGHRLLGDQAAVEVGRIAPRLRVAEKCLHFGG